MSTPDQTTDAAIRHEADQLERVFADRPDQLIGLLSGQLSVLKSKATSFLSLCGLAITVTGFSGAHMIRAGSIAAASMVLGILLILIAALICLRSMTRIRWVTQDLQPSLAKMAQQVIRRRDAQQASLQQAGVFVASGLAAYLVAVSLSAFLN